VTLGAVLPVAGAGLFMVVVGTLGFAGRLGRESSSSWSADYSGFLLMGVATILACAMSLLRADSAGGMLLGLPTVSVLCLALYAFMFGPPRWGRPRWQRELDDVERAKGRVLR
jgi:hypothetical protein